MGDNFFIEYCLSPVEIKHIEKYFFVKVNVHWQDDRRRKKQFFYCIECWTIFGRSGFFSHKETFLLEQAEAKRRADHFLANREWHTNNIIPQIRSRFERGRMSRASIPIEPDGPFPFTPVHPQRPTPERRHIHHRVPLVVEHQQEMTVEEPQEPILEETASIENNFPQLLDCLSVDGFDTEQFNHFARDFFKESQ